MVELNLGSSAEQPEHVPLGQTETFIVFKPAVEVGVRKGCTQTTQKRVPATWSHKLGITRRLGVAIKCHVDQTGHYIILFRIEPAAAYKADI